jgi:hypothetical protein
MTLSTVDKKNLFQQDWGWVVLVSKALMSFLFHFDTSGCKVMVSAKLIIVACVLIGVSPTWFVYLCFSHMACVLIGVSFVAS